MHEGGLDPALAGRRDCDFGPRETFVPQRAIAVRRAKWIAAAAFGACLGLLAWLLA
jgi:hypothetical protein